MRMWKFVFCIVGILLFLSNPWRDWLFYEAVAANEGFGTIHDAWWTAVYHQLVASFALLPLCIALIAYGIFKAKVIRLRPRFDRFTFLWGSIATVLAALMVLVEIEHICYAIKYPHHWPTGIISAVYVAFIYVWWLCSISHKTLPNSSAQR